MGAVFLINGRVVGLDSFGKPDTLARVFKKLFQSYALDAIDFLEPDTRGGALEKARRFLEYVQNTCRTVHPFIQEEGYGLIFHDARYIIRRLFRVLYSVS